MITVTRYSHDGQELRPGVRVRYQSNCATLTFDYSAVLDSEKPEVWHGEARLRGQLLLTTGPHGSELSAGKAAEVEILDRLVNILGRPAA